MQSDLVGNIVDDKWVIFTLSARKSEQNFMDKTIGKIEQYVWRCLRQKAIYNDLFVIGIRKDKG